MWNSSIIKRGTDIQSRGLISIERIEKESIYVVLNEGNLKKQISLNIFSSTKEQSQEYCSIFLAALLQILYLKNTKKKKRVYEELLKKSGYEKLPFDLSSIPLFKEEACDVILESYKNLELYSLLLGKATSTEKVGLIPSRYAKHILELYGPYNFHVAIDAMDALLRRIKSAEDGTLKIVSRPPRRRTLGDYKVLGHLKGIPYDVRLVSSKGIDGSCTCLDFRKSTLRFCKHMAKIDLYFGAHPRIRKNFFRETRSTFPLLRFIPPVQYEKVINPLEGLCLEAYEKELSPKEINEVKKYFLWNSNHHRHYLHGALGKKDSIQKLVNLERYSTRKEKRNIFSVDPALKAVIRENIEELKVCQKLRSYDKKFRRALSGQKIKLFSYQKEGVLSALSAGRFLLADDMGLGKTIQGISWGNALLQNKLVKRLMVICPASLKYQWQQEWHKAVGVSPSIVDGYPEERRKIYESKEKIFIINYELILRDLHLIQKAAPTAVILDEAQRIKNFETKTACNIKQLTSPYRLILTGTPFENRITELMSLMDWINGRALGPSWRLLPETTYRRTSVEDRNITGVTNLDVLRKRIQPFFLRRTREKILDQLPKRIDTPIVLPITASQEEIHEELKIKVAKLLKILEIRPLKPQEHLRLMSLLAKMRIVSNATALYHFEDVWPSIRDDDPAKRLKDIDSPKLTEFRSIVSSFLRQKGVKIVVFSQWTRMLTLASWAVGDILRQEDVEAVFFTGKQNRKKRVENITQFHDDPDVRIFFATDAGGVGLNLQKAASVCINLDLAWNPAVMEQRIARIHRLGQERPVHIYNLVTENCIESRIFNLIEQKKLVFKSFFDGTTNEVLFDKSKNFLSQVKNVIGKVEELPLVDDIDFIETSPSDETEDRENNILKEKEEERPIKTTYPSRVSSSSSVYDLTNIFSGIHVSKNQSGEVTIKAQGDSAKVLSEIFKNLGTLLENVPSTFLPPSSSPSEQTKNLYQ